MDHQNHQQPGQQPAYSQTPSSQPVYSQTAIPQTGQQPIYRQAYAQPASAYPQTASQVAPVQVPAPAVKPKKGWGKLLAALICLPLFIVGGIIGLYAGDATILGEDIGTELGSALVGIALCCILGGSSLFNITKKSWKWAWHALWWSIAISAAIAALDLYDHISTDSLYLVDDWPWQIFLSVVFCVLIGFFEETMARGVVLNGLLARMGTNRKGMVWACILSSLFFGLLHVDLLRIGSVTMLEFGQGALKVIQTGMYGFALAAVVCKTGELTSAALLHGLDDWLLFILTFAMGDSLKTEYVSAGTEEGWATVIVYVICIALYVPLVIRAAHTLKTIEPTRGAFFRERKGVAAAPSVPAAAAPAYAVPAPQGYQAQQQYAAQQYAQQQYAQQQYAAQTYAQQPPASSAPPAGYVPTQVPEGSLYQTGQSGAQTAQTPQDPRTPR